MSIEIIGALWVVIEQAIRAMKTFKILAGPYRNKGKRLGVRLIAAIVLHVFELEVY